MNMWKSAFAGLICLGLWSGCKEEQATGKYPFISVKKEVGSKRYAVHGLSRYAGSVRYVPLETSDSTLIKRISRIYLENGKIYVNDGYTRCLVFSAADGSYVGDVGRLGQGPGEFTVLRSMDILPSSDRIYILGSDLYISEFTLSGRYLRKFRTDPVGNDFPYQIKASDTSCLVIDLISWEQIEHIFYICDDSARIRHAQANTQPFLKENGNFLDREMAIMNRCGDEIHYVKPAADTLFAVKKNASVNPLYVFDYGKYREPLDWRVAGARENFGRYINLKSIKESDDFLFLEFNFNKWAPEPYKEKFYDHEDRRRERISRRVYGIYDKKNGRLSLLKLPSAAGPGLKNDFDGGPAFWPAFISSTGEMVMFMTAEDFLEYQEAHPFPVAGLDGRLDFDSNPVVIIASPKK